ncbi:MAG: tetratricopeptide repeat protein [Bacteroidales bacterium]
MRKLYTSLKIFCAISLLFTSTILFSQRNANEKERFELANNLFVDEMYSDAYKEFGDILRDYPKLPNLKKAQAESLRLLCVMKLKRPNIDGLVLAYEKQYPYSNNIARVRFYQGTYYFEAENYVQALAIYNSIKNRYLSRDERISYIFDRAYCNMRVGNNELASSGFKKILSFPRNKYSISSTYYLGYIYYLDKDFSQAIPLFNRLKNDDRFSHKAKYFLCESYFMKDDYDYVIKNAVPLLDHYEGNFHSQLIRMISESWFAKGNKRKAKDYLDLYRKSGNNLSRKDNYYSGLVSYSLNAYLSAIGSFIKVVEPNQGYISSKDTLSQYAYYYLGNSYLKVKNKYEAMKAYKKASEMYFDKSVKEETSFTYAKLLFDINKDISGFESYMLKYSSSSKSDEIYNYIGTAYLLNKDYKRAVVSLSKISLLDRYMTLNLQKAAFFRGMQLYKMGSFRLAIESFEVGLSKGEINQNLNYLCNYWLAESYYRSGLYDKSIEINKHLLSSDNFKSCDEYYTTIYNLSYDYFKLHDYVHAEDGFKVYLELPPSSRIYTNEAKLRLADTYFMQRDYERSAELFEEISHLYINQKAELYADYYSAISYGLISREDKKIEMLKNIKDNKAKTPLYFTSIYELGRTYLNLDDIDDALNCFNLLLREKQDSTYYSKALLEMGLLYSKKNNNNRALSYFDKVVKNYSPSQESRDALSGIKAVYESANKTDEYLAYLDANGMSSSVTDDERELMLFNSCEKYFLAENYTQAENSLLAFVEKYPIGPKTSQAYFYLGESRKEIGKAEAAADAYKKVMDIGVGSFRELATLNYAEIAYSLSNYQEAILAYKTLLSIAKLDNSIYIAKVGLMRSYYKETDYKNAKISSDVLISSKINVDMKEEATYVKAKSLSALGERDASLVLFKVLSAKPYNPYGAESYYILAKRAYEEGNFEEVEKIVYAFSDKGSSQLYWLAKCFIVLGDSFAERAEYGQAKATFESIKKEYKPQSDTDDVLENVDMRLDKLSVIVGDLADSVSDSTNIIKSIGK